MFSHPVADDQLSPESSVSALISDDALVHTLGVGHVLTIRQLTQCTELDLRIILRDKYEFEDWPKIIKRGKEIVQKTVKPVTQDIWVYRYASKADLRQIEKDKQLKSAYVLFEEYMNCPNDEIATHPWKQVYQTYTRKASQYMGYAPQHGCSDVELYAYLVWKGATHPMGKHDTTSGTRAITGHWAPLTYNNHQRIDMADSNHRYSCIVAINLTSLVNQEGAKIYQGSDGSELTLRAALNWALLSPRDATTVNEEGSRDGGRCIIITPSGSIGVEHLRLFEGNATEHLRLFEVTPVDYIFENWYQTVKQGYIPN